MEASNVFFLVYVEVIVLLSCFNLHGFNLLGLVTASPVVRGNGTDQHALLQFKTKVTGDPLKIMESWNISIHFCQWHGVTCDNSFYNQIPQEIGRLRRLETLQLTNNSIRGEIPSNLSACSKLTLVDMRSNQLAGEIPASLGLLSNLKFLNFANNSLKGSIPPLFGNLSSLEVLSLAINALSATIPEALGQLTNFSFFSIYGNAISGNFPMSIFNLSKIRSFDIGANKIQGTLHSDLGITMPSIEFFSVAGNQISGQIPISISNASNLNVLLFNDNRLSGNVPSLEKLDKLVNLGLGKNHFGHGKEGDLKFLCSLVNATKLKFLYIGTSNFGGELPKCISNFSTTLLNLVIEQNKIMGRIPNGIGNLINLEVLSALENQLSGPIPFEIGRLQKLNIFFAYTNFLSGTITNSIGNLTMLIKLALNENNLQGSIPISLGNCQNLLLLDLSNNNLSGSIPHEVLRLQSLSIWLDLSSNYLTGELPGEVEKLKNLGRFYCSQNRLSGLLPRNLGSCVSLETLSLDDNLFEGPIPSSWSSLRGLVQLDLSENNLSGGIPEFFVTFGALKYLNLSFNDFDGVIPSEGVFKNASATFVEGNNKLCGGIPELHLSRCNSKTSSTTSVKLKIAIIVVMLGVALVFTCPLVLWFTKKRQQHPRTICEENWLLQLSYQSILRATNGFSTQNLVGAGSFGSVYKGILEESGEVIAVKVLSAISGIDRKGNDFKALAYEFMENGSLEDWLYPSTSMNEPETMRNLNFIQRVNVAVDVAHALEYLHHRCETPIIHCDLKPSNILLDEEMVGHISDFGLAKILSGDELNYSANESISLGLRGTIGYAPPEYGMGSELSTNGVVYSYGILLLEMLTGKRPTNKRFKEGLSLHNFVKAALPNRVVEIIDPILLQESVRGGTVAGITLNENNLGNDEYLQCLNSIFKIGLTCSAESPSERMDMSDVVTKLCSIKDKLLRPTRLYRGIRTAYDAKPTGNNVFLS
ncbi:hypothetical protein ES319_D10G258900v1 [Gossypium barbadense]|uniref:non-specific serine/threonine protein kinase n=1 Tax=Gossypium barbadense TaxID=3634 RepID=A0A5J5PVT1_GOSBA|nr:hypothetical protein ES319_D10G258900v1 [Gossypium barbadense]